MAELASQAVSQVSSMIVTSAFASSIKKDQKKFEKEIAKLDSQKQNELLQKMQQVQTELERQNIVFQYIVKSRIDELKEQTKKENKYLYIAIGVGILIYGLMIINLRKNE